MNKLFDRNTKAGFTLVELIIVIAILGILAGIAIPVYSGYIKKANEAADQTLLGAVNTAFAAACIENTADPRSVNATATISTSGVTVNPFDEAFQRYFAGNESFKVFKSLVYIKSEGVFAGSKVAVASNGNGTYTVTLSNGKNVTYTVSDDTKQAITDSTFGSNMSMGELMGDVSSVVNAAKTALNMDEDTLTGIIGDDYLKELGLMDDEGNLKDGVNADQLSNALVMFVADNTDESIIDTVQSFMEGEDFSIDLTDMGGTLSTIAAMYGLMTGFANSDTGRTATIEVDGKKITVYDYYNQSTASLSNSGGGMTGLLNVVDMMQNIAGCEALGDYISLGTDEETGDTIVSHSSQGYKDLMGYISAMDVISGNTEALNGTGVLSSGFADNDIVAILNGILNP